MKARTISISNSLLKSVCVSVINVVIAWRNYDM